MTTQEVANRLVELCRNGQIEQAQTELFSDDAISIDLNMATGGLDEVKGLEAIKEKGAVFQSMLEEFHGATISDPVVGGNCFSISWILDAKMKGRDRGLMAEICVYKVKNGKVIHEQFFF